MIFGGMAVGSGGVFIAAVVGGSPIAGREVDIAGFSDIGPGNLPDLPVAGEINQIVANAEQRGRGVGRVAPVESRSSWRSVSLICFNSDPLPAS